MGAIFVILFVILIIVLVNNQYLRNSLRNSNENKEIELELDESSYHDILISKSSYYIALSEAGKKKFLKRLTKFIDNIRFQSMEGMDLTQEMVVLISSSAIQLTFGFEYYLLSEYVNIYVYPDAIYSPGTGEFHAGQTNIGNSISISWKNFIEGYADKSDKINVGLHEMAHALEFSFLIGDKYDQSFADYYDALQEKQKEELLRMRQGKASVIRSYGANNLREFFAVCVEYFFEDPIDFRKELPELYICLCLLLNQEPTNISNDYQFAKEQEVYKRVAKNTNNRSWQWWLNVILFGMFISPVGFLFTFPETIIGIDQILMLIAFVSVISGMGHYRYFKKNAWMGNVFFAVYNIIGIGITTISLLLIINQYVMIGKEETNYYKIMAITGTRYEPMQIEAEIYFPELKNTKKIGVPAATSENMIGKQLLIKTRRGLFFYKVILEVRLEK